MAGTVVYKNSCYDEREKNLLSQPTEIREGEKSFCKNDKLHYLNHDLIAMFSQ